MIVILKQEGLPREHRRRTVESLTLEHTNLSKAMIEQADLIVFVEGRSVNFLKNSLGMRVPNDLDLLLELIASRTSPAKKYRPINVKNLGQRRPHGNLRRRKRSQHELSASPKP